jgi:UDP-N-acetylglucosamine 2-epimerase (non-hydrolysing)
VLTLRKRIVLVFGTRAETVKMAPVAAELARRAAHFESDIVVTGQHRELLDPFLECFGLHPSCDLHIMTPGQSLAQLTARSLAALEGAIRDRAPDLVLVQGDTATMLAGALAAFYEKVSVGHVEAGLRTDQKYDPFPEELFRRLTTVIADLHFAPTERARDALRREHVPEEAIYLTGNTVVDALLAVAESRATLAGTEFEWLADDPRRLILVTAHRRENLGERHRRVFTALRNIAAAHEDVVVLYPVHPNAEVRRVAEDVLSGAERVILCEPPGYLTFVALMQRCALIVTDSGGVQEEAPALGKPVLVIRETTERPEGIEAGVARLVGTETRNVQRAIERLLTDRGEYENMARAANPYGDGRASVRIADALEHAFGLRADRPADFVPGGPA